VFRGQNFEFSNGFLETKFDFKLDSPVSRLTAAAEAEARGERSRFPDFAANASLSGLLSA
jgi:hypothetical protein